MACLDRPAMESSSCSTLARADDTGNDAADWLSGLFDEKDGNALSAWTFVAIPSADAFVSSSSTNSSNCSAWRFDATYLRWLHETARGRKREQRASAERRRFRDRQVTFLCAWVAQGCCRVHRLMVDQRTNGLIRLSCEQTEIHEMRQQIRQLESQHESLCSMADRVRNASSRNAREGGSLQWQAHEMHRLHCENAYLRQLLEKKTHLQHLVQAAVEDSAPVASSPAQIRHWKDPQADDRVRGICFIPFTSEQCLRIIRSDYEEHFERRPNCSDDAVVRKLPFGWRGFAVIEQSTKVRYQQTKTWTIAPLEASELTWKCLNVPSKYRRANLAPRTVEILQRVTDDIFVFRRVTENTRNGCNNFSVYMMYRMRLGESFLIGMVPLPLWGSGKSVFVDDPYGKSLLGLRESVVLKRSHALYEPVALQDPSQTGTTVTRWGSIDCENTDDAEFWLREVFDMMLRFEYLLLFPIVNKRLLQETS